MKKLQNDEFCGTVGELLSVVGVLLVSVEGVLLVSVVTWWVGVPGTTSTWTSSGETVVRTVVVVLG